MDFIENQNSSCSRRGAEVAHSIYGVATTINASGYGYFLALEKLFDLQHADVSGSFSHFCIRCSLLMHSYSTLNRQAGKIYTEQVLEIHRGQGMDIYWRDNCICPKESEYKQMAVHKTGGLFTLIVRLMELFSDSDKDLSRLTAQLALYYHIRDDYCSLVSEKVCGNRPEWNWKYWKLIRVVFSIRRSRASVKISPKANSITQSFMQWIIERWVIKYRVSIKAIPLVMIFSVIETHSNFIFNLIRYPEATHSTQAIENVHDSVAREIGQFQIHAGDSIGAWSTNTGGSEQIGSQYPYGELTRRFIVLGTVAWKQPPLVNKNWRIYFFEY